MDILGLYIKQALQDKGEIYLPGIGTFKKERIPAFFNDLKQCFIPPTQSIVLTDKQANQSLIQYVAEKENIDLEESRLKIEQSISELQTELQEKEEVSLADLGNLKRIDNRYEFSHFQPSFESSFNDYEPITEAEVLIPIENKVNIPLPAVDLDKEEEILPVELAINEEELEEERSSRKWLWPVLAFVIVAAIAGFWFLNPNFDINGLINKTGSVSNTQTVEEVTEPPAQSTDVNAQAQVSEPIEQVIQSPVTDVSESMVKEVQEGFEIIIAAFNTMEEAEAYVNRTNAKGYNVYIIKNNNPGNLNKISYGTFQTASEAEEALTKVREELTKEAWIFEKKIIKN
jgi:nucleoid DNA-binding protein